MLTYANQCPIKCVFHPKTLVRICCMSSKMLICSILKGKISKVSSWKGDDSKEDQGLSLPTEHFICNQSKVLLSTQNVAWERPVASLLALCEVARVRTGLLFVGRASENAVSLQMRGFYKAQDTENGHICKSSRAVYKRASAAWGCLKKHWGNNTEDKEVLIRRIFQFHSVYWMKYNDPHWAFQTWRSI